MTAGHVIVTLLSAMTTASSLFIVAAGLTLVFGAMRIINIAHGSFYMYGAFLVTTIVGSVAAGGFWLALVVAPLAVGVLGSVVEVTVLRRIYAQEHLVQLLATYALFLIFADLALRIWGKQNRSVTAPSLLRGSVDIGNGRFPTYDLFAIAVAIAVGLALWLVLSRTALGWRIRAAVEDPETLSAGGTNVPLLSTTVFAIGALLAGLGGAVIAPLQAIAPGLDASIIVSAFIVAVIGGLGSVAGAAIGAVIIGLFEASGVLWAPTWAPTFIYLAMILVLGIRPWGLLGTAER
ncbi:MAG: branched-chain amino acid ABC transporter permease [Sciscionella sp.]